VFRKLRYTVTIDIVALVLGMALNLALIPTAGAQGAALAFLLAIIIRSVPYPWALHRIAGVKLMTRDYLRLQGLIALMLGLLLVIQILLDPPLLVALVLAGATGAVVVVASRDMLQIEQAFPELGVGRLGALIRLTEGRLPGRRRNSD
jgi:O-antigen/teichoic acid export membrane protein